MPKAVSLKSKLHKSKKSWSCTAELMVRWETVGAVERSLRKKEHPSKPTGKNILGNLHANTVPGKLVPCSFQLKIHTWPRVGEHRLKFLPLTTRRRFGCRQWALLSQACEVNAVLQPVCSLPCCLPFLQLSSRDGSSLSRPPCAWAPSGDRDFWGEKREKQGRCPCVLSGDEQVLFVCCVLF